MGIPADEFTRVIGQSKPLASQVVPRCSAALARWWESSANRSIASRLIPCFRRQAFGGKAHIHGDVEFQPRGIRSGLRG